VSGRAHWLGWGAMLVVFIWSARATSSCTPAGIIGAAVFSSTPAKSGGAGS